MVFWILAIVVTTIACAALYYAAARHPVNAAPAGAMDATNAHFRLQLKEIDGDVASERLGVAEALAAKGEMARELLRVKEEGRGVIAGGSRTVFVVAIGLTALVALGAYAFLGRPDLPSLPLASREAPAPEIDVTEAVNRIETQLGKTPDDLRGWSVIAPAYMQLGRFADAARAYRRIFELGGATADSETDLGEAIMMGQEGSVAGEPLALFRSAVARDPNHVRSRFYLASEATRAGDYADAVAQWTALLALAKGDESWVGTARSGLAAATAGLDGDAGVPDAEAIDSMVEGLAARLAQDGGSIAEWTQLVRSRLVLGQTELAQAHYDAARKAYPDAAVRIELDVLAADNGLVAREAAP